MTEALQQWAWKQSVSEADGYEQSHALSPRVAEFWIRAFCGDVEKRAKARNCNIPYCAACFHGSFDEIKRRLLGEDEQPAP